MTKAISLAMMLFFGIATTTLPVDTTISKNYVVVVDAGHGGKDTGAVSGGVREKDLNLDVAKRLDALLQEEGIQTYMTRTDDSFVELYDRSGLANLVKADLLVSIHHNAGSSKVSGTMNLYYPAEDGKGKRIATIFQQELTAALETKNQGVIARPNLAVLRTSNMPAVLVEIGYMTNKEELGRLQTEAFRQRAATALKEAVIKSLAAISE